VGAQSDFKKLFLSRRKYLLYIRGRMGRRKGEEYEKASTGSRSKHDSPQGEPRVLYQETGHAGKEMQTTFESAET